MPQFMFLVKADPMAESVDVELPTEAFEAMCKFNEEMADAGVLLAAEGFRPTSVDGYRIKYSSTGPPDVINGPFDVSKENHVCGFWLVETKDAEEALAWAKKVPFPEGELLVRRIAGHDELGVSFTKELKDKEDKLRVKVAANRKAVGM